MAAPSHESVRRWLFEQSKNPRFSELPVLGKMDRAEKWFLAEGGSEASAAHGWLLDKVAELQADLDAGPVDVDGVEVPWFMDPDRGWDVHWAGFDKGKKVKCPGCGSESDRLKFADSGWRCRVCIKGPARPGTARRGAGKRRTPASEPEQATRKGRKTPRKAHPRREKPR